MIVRVQNAAFDFTEEVNLFQAATKYSGAIVTFSGIVRDDSGDLDYMLIEHYPGMTESALEKFSIAARVKFDLEHVLVIHRFGVLRKGETIMMVATAAKHRKDAFSGANYLMDYLKSRAPFWKKEVKLGQPDGAWVDAKVIDETALDAWSN
jgi:molybdopterin synthase catalytic subunit